MTVIKTKTIQNSQTGSDKFLWVSDPFHDAISLPDVLEFSNLLNRDATHSHATYGLQSHERKGIRYIHWKDLQHDDSNVYTDNMFSTIDIIV